jgi:hypothetical protein
MNTEDTDALLRKVLAQLEDKPTPEQMFNTQLRERLTELADSSVLPESADDSTDMDARIRAARRKPTT